jgi:hypothetical protein
MLPIFELVDLFSRNFVGRLCQRRPDHVTLKTEAVWASEPLVPYRSTIRRHNSEDLDMNRTIQFPTN